MLVIGICLIHAHFSQKLSRFYAKVCFFGIVYVVVYIYLIQFDILKKTFCLFSFDVPGYGNDLT